MWIKIDHDHLACSLDAICFLVDNGTSASGVWKTTTSTTMVDVVVLVNVLVDLAKPSGPLMGELHTNATVSPTSQSLQMR